MKGIFSPWAKKEAAPASPFDGARVGKQPVRVAGGAYVFIITLQVRPKPENADPLGMAVLGEALQALTDATPTFAEELDRQKLKIGERPLGPCVPLAFGNTTVFAVASSTDLDTATKMAVDRLAMAITRLFQREPAHRKILDEHFVQTVRVT